MPRTLLILLIITMSGTGCTASRPLFSRVVFTPPKLSIRQLPSNRQLPSKERSWTAVAVTYQTDVMAPIPCGPTPTILTEPVTFLDEVNSDTAPATEEAATFSVSSVTVDSGQSLPVDHTANTPTSVMKVDSPYLFPTPQQHLDNSVDTLPDNKSAFTVTTPTTATPSIVQTAATTLNPLPCAPVTPPPAMESDWRPTTRIPNVTEESTDPIPQNTTISSEVRPSQPITPLPPIASPNAQMHIDLTALLTEIRQQRQLIETLQRDLLRERSADNAAMDELEAAVDHLLVQTQNALGELPATLQK